MRCTEAASPSSNELTLLMQNVSVRSDDIPLPLIDTPFRIKDLPAEILLQILGLAVSDGFSGIRFGRSSFSIGFSWWPSNRNNRSDTTTWHNLFLTSKSVHGIVGPMVFRYLKINLSSKWAYGPKRCNFFKLGPSCFRWVQEVEIMYSADLCESLRSDSYHSYLAGPGKGMRGSGMMMTVRALQLLHCCGANLCTIKLKPIGSGHHLQPCHKGDICADFKRADFKLAVIGLDLFKNLQSVIFDLRSHCQDVFTQIQQEELCCRLGLKLKEQAGDSVTWTAFDPDWSPTNPTPFTPQQIEEREAGWAIAAEQLLKDVENRW